MCSSDLGADLESKFAALEGAPEVDAELAAMKQRLSGGQPQVSLPPADSSEVQRVTVSEVDGELEALKRSIEQR